MKTFRKKVMFCIAAIATICAVMSPVRVYAGEAPYNTLTYDKDGYLVSTVDGYLPKTLWDKFGDAELKKPSDIFIYDNREIYIADTGNKRILVCDLEGNFLREISEGLKGPTGVFVTEDGLVYAADPQAGLILVYDREGSLAKTYGTPDSPLFGKNAKYAPTKVIVNNSNTIYALSEGNANGILTISEYGDFYGYFGANDTDLSLINKIKRAVFTEEQLSSMQKNVPSSAVNLDIDSTGLIYTVTQGLGDNGLKKFNLAGSNMFTKAYADTLVTDVAVGPIDNIYTVSKQGYIIEITKDEGFLFYFGGNDDRNNRMGLFTNAVAIDVDADNRLYVLDGDRGDITVFEPTEYAVTVHDALSKYQEGFYLESKEPWERALSQNSLLDHAHSGIAKALYKLEDYDGSMTSARLGGAESTYSSAFWQIRNIWLRNNVVTVFWILLAFFILRWIWKKYGDRIFGIRKIKELLRKFRELKLVRELRFIGYVLRNPADAFYGIKREGKVSVLSANILYILIFVIYIVNKYYCGFLFKTVPDGQYDLIGDILKVPGLMLLFVICCNMICTIRDGEATFKQTYCSFAYCFMPYIFLKPAVIVLSHALTYNESFIITLLNFVMIAGTIVLIVVMIRENQCFSYKETFVCILLTLFTMLVLIAAGVILFALFKQVIDFIVGIYKEGYYRGR